MTVELGLEGKFPEYGMRLSFSTREMVCPQEHPIVKGPHGVNLHTIELHHTGQPVVRIWVDLQVVESR